MTWPGCFERMRPRRWAIIPFSVRVKACGKSASQRDPLHVRIAAQKASSLTCQLADLLTSTASPIKNLKLVAGVGGEESGNMPEAFGQGRRGDERVFALAQIGVVEVDGEREQVDRDSVGEGGLEVVGLGLFV